MRLTVLGGCARLGLEADRRTLAYTGDSGPSPDLHRLARGADLLLAEASCAREVPDDSVLAAAEGYTGPIAVASPGLTAEIDR